MGNTLPNPNKLTEEQFCKKFDMYAKNYYKPIIEEYFPVICEKYSDSTVLTVLRSRWLDPFILNIYQLENVVFEQFFTLLKSGKIKSAQYIVETCSFSILLECSMNYMTKYPDEIRSVIISRFWSNIDHIIETGTYCDDILFLLFSSHNLSTILQKDINHYTRIAIQKELNKSLDLLFPYAEFYTLKVNKRALLEYATKHNLVNVIASLSPGNVLPPYEKVTSLSSQS